MKRGLLKVASIAGAIVGIALLIAGALVAWAVGTESGLKFVWQQVAHQLPDTLEVAALEGRLSGPLELRGVRLRTPTLEVRIERAELEWRPLALLAKFLAIDRVRVYGLDVVQLPPDSQVPATGGELPLPEGIALPFDVEVGSASLEDLRYRSSPAAEELLVARVDLAGSLDDEQWVLRELAIRGPLFDATARARIVPHGVYETEGQVDWVLRPGNVPDANGSTRFSGSLQALDVEHRVEAPYNASAAVHVRQPLTELGLDGELTLTVQPATLGVELPNSTVNINVSFAGTLEQVDLRGRVELDSERFDRLEAEVHARYAERALQIDALHVAHPASAARIEASGQLNVAQGLALDLRSTWAGLRWPLQDAPFASSESGIIEVRGTLDDYVLALDAELATRDGTRGRAQLGGTGNLEALNLEQIEIAALRGHVTGRAHLRWQPHLSAAIELTGNELDPGTLMSDWPGRLGARVRADTVFDEGGVTVRVGELTVDGELRDRPIELVAEGEYSTDTLRVERLSLHAGATQIDASGTAGRDVALRWRVDSPDLGDLWSGLGGRLVASGTLNGPRMRPRVTVDASGEGLRFADSEAAELNLRADIDVAGQAPSQIDLAVRAATVNGTYIEQLGLNGSGNAARHELAFAATTDLGQAQIDLVGQIAEAWQKNYVWSFTLDTATFAHATFPAWHLREPASGRISAAQAQLSHTCWLSGEADLCVDGARDRDRTLATISLAELPFAYFAPAFVDPVQIDGDMSIEGAFEQRSGGPPELDVQLSSSVGNIVAAEAGAVEPYVLAFGPLAGRVTMKEDRIAGEVSLPFEEHGQLELQARVGAGVGEPFAERTLDGTLEVEIDGLGFVSKVVEGLQDTAGRVDGDVQLSGTIGEPLATGRLALEDGKATVRAANVVLEDLAVVLASDGGRDITVEAGGRSGGGSVQARGLLALGEAGPEGRITVKGEAFEVIDTQDAQVILSPDLALALEPDRLTLTGSVTVPKARLTPRETDQSVVAASADQVIVDTEGERARVLARPLYADVRLELGSDVQLEGYGLTGSLGGSIKIAEVPGEPTTGTGELRVEKGVYEAYGQKLEVQTGRLLFAGGPIDQPGLDVEAVRRPAEGILVGARVRGTLAAPTLTVFSNPQMPQQEQLSYLVLGRPLQSASASESSAMSRAALALGLKGGNFVSERINENLGLDEFGIQTDPGESSAEASFVIGKYLSPSLYVSYGIGLFEPVNTLRLKYTISGRWQLVTESSSDGSGGDLIYNIERK